MAYPVPLWPAFREWLYYPPVRPVMAHPVPTRPATPELFQDPYILPQKFPRIAYRLERMVEQGNIVARLLLGPNRPTVFHCLHADRNLGRFGLLWYLERIHMYLRGCDIAYILACIYLERYNRIYFIDSVNVHRLLHTSIVLGFQAFYGRRMYTDGYFALAGGLLDARGLGNAREMEEMERQFRFALGHNSDIHPSEVDWYYNNML